MSRNIKEIGKELLGKSLNSFHRKTGLTQLEENNKVQDGILNGILSQVDDAYIEKTEQSNVIHLDGSGDGVVVLDGIEGNTMVNMIDVDNTHGTYIIENTKNTGIIYGKTTILKPNTTYTIMYYIKGTTEVNVTSVSSMFRLDSYNQDGSVINGFFHGFTGKLTTNYQFVKSKFETTNNIGFINLHVRNAYHDYALESNTLTVKDVIILEGDWTNRETPSHFIGLQSSFEENVEEDKYKIEILMKNKNLIDTKAKFPYVVNSTTNNGRNVGVVKCLPNTQYAIHLKTNNEKGVVTCVCSPKEFTQEEMNGLGFQSICYNYSRDYYNGVKFEWQVIGTDKKETILTPPNTKYIYINSDYRFGIDFSITSIQLEKGSVATSYTKPKYNKIKLLINEPLRAVGDIKDKLCIVNNKLMVERNCEEHQYSPLKQTYTYGGSNYNVTYFTVNDTLKSNGSAIISDKLISTIQAWAGHSIGIGAIKVNGENRIIHSHEESGEVFLSKLNSLLPKYVYVLAEPYYEEVLNEYGEPILLEGYENGTIYIDSTIVPTTSVRYTPKMESFKTLKEVNNNNIMLTNDIDDNIIPYMMDVDLMIMKKEMALMSQYKIRRMGAKDMASMQKRTQDMLERLIKGKTLTEQECKTRITTYLNAGKITDTQAEELNFLIDEIYA